MIDIFLFYSLGFGCLLISDAYWLLSPRFATEPVKLVYDPYANMCSVILMACLAYAPHYIFLK